MKHLKLEQIEPTDVQFSICTLVTDWNQYTSMRSSFAQKGFSDDQCEFIVADNSKGNEYDAYEACNDFITKSRAPYIIICHQDIVLLNDGYNELDSRLEELENHDPNWAVAGNAGAVKIKDYYFRITENDGRERNTGPFPAKVHSLDENFLILKRAANIGFSRDLKGFHFYGTDICIHAESLGWESYVINFHLRHNSGGSLNTSFFEQKHRLISKYRNAWRPRYVQTTCTRFFLSSSSFLNWLLNLRFPMFMAKEYYKRFK